MVYNPTIWINDDGTGTVGTPVIADHMNNIEQGIVNNSEQINVCIGARNEIPLQAGWCESWTNTPARAIEEEYNSDMVHVKFEITGGVADNETLVLWLPIPYKAQWINGSCMETGLSVLMYLNWDGGLKLGTGFESSRNYFFDFNYRRRW